MNISTAESSQSRIAQNFDVKIHEEKIMSFVNELIPEDDKKKLDPSLYKSKLGGNPIHLWKWTIDRGQDAFLLFSDGGRDDIPEFYILTWKGQLIRFSAFVTGDGNRSTGVSLMWRVSRVDIPTAIEASRPKVFSMKVCTAS